MKPSSKALLAQFYAQHAPLVRRALDRRGVRAADLDDVVQDAFVTIHRLLPEFEGRSSPETWLHAIAWRVAARYHRRRRTHPELSGHGHDDLASAPQPLDASELPAALRVTDAQQRDLLALHEIGGMPISMLAELTGHARATVRQRLARGRAVLNARTDTRAAELAAQTWPLPAQDPPPHASELRMLPCGAGYLSQLDDIVFGVWHGHCTVDAMRALGDALAAALAIRPEGIRYMSIVEPSSTPPRFEARQVHVALAREFGPHLRAVSTVVEARAMMPLVSGLMNAYLAIARTPLHIRYFGDLPSALDWFVPFGTTDAERITAHVAAVRSRRAMDAQRSEP